MREQISVVYRKANGDTAYVNGAGIELGYGVRRDIPAFGVRRFLWHFAFGYVSGFPAKDILYFSLYSLNPWIGHLMHKREGNKCLGVWDDQKQSVRRCKRCDTSGDIIPTANGETSGQLH